MRSPSCVSMPAITSQTDPTLFDSSEPSATGMLPVSVGPEAVAASAASKAARAWLDLALRSRRAAA